MQKILIIGWDGATFDLIKPWVEAGKLPVLGQLIQSGAHGTLLSTVPAMSPPAWTSMITGQNPGKHGIYDFVRRQPGSYRLQSIRRDFTPHRTVFDYLSTLGKRVAAINIPATYPPAEVNGITIAGLGAPGKGNFTYPQHLKKELEAIDYKIDVDQPYIPGEDDAFITTLQEIARIHQKVALDLYRREPWDLFMVVFRAIDEAQGFLWHHFDETHPLHQPQAAEKYRDAVLLIHQELDRLLGEFMNEVDDETTVFVVSDHGGGPLVREVYLNNWLAQSNWLVLKEPLTSNKFFHQQMRSLGWTQERLAPKFSSPFWLKIRQAVPLKWQHAVLPHSSPTLEDRVDWSRTQAYSFGYIGQIYINLKGREPEGIIEPGLQYNRLLDDIVDRLDTLYDEEFGLKVVDRVYRRDELYWGPYAHLGPDLNVIMRGMSYITHSRRELAYAQTFGPVTTQESGTHRPNGIMIVAGSEIAQIRLQEPSHVMDIVPTLLWLLNLPIPDDIDGQIIQEAIAPACWQQRTVRKVSVAAPMPQPALLTWTDEEEQEVIERLKDLGYME